MTRLNVNDARCEALFASALQQSDAPTAQAVAEVISRTVRQLGIGGCASRMAQEFGDHPEAALDRMRWVRQLVGELPASRAPRACPASHRERPVRRLTSRGRCDAGHPPRTGLPADRQGPSAAGCGRAPRCGGQTA